MTSRLVRHEKHGRMPISLPIVCVYLHIVYGYHSSSIDDLLGCFPSIAYGRYSVRQLASVVYVVNFTASNEYMLV